MPETLDSKKATVIGGLGLKVYQFQPGAKTLTALAVTATAFRRSDKISG